jgi:CelD/BcsL family acetyltransferase involved in cellulose biosynthesis
VESSVNSAVAPGRPDHRAGLSRRGAAGAQADWSAENAKTGGASSTPIGTLTLAVRRDVEWSPEDLASLDRLIELRPHVGLFLSRSWLSGFFADPPADEEPTIVECREDGVLRGLIPVTIRRARECVHIGLLGGALGSDRVDLLAARGFESQLADMFLDWIQKSFGRDGFTLRLRDVPDDSPLWSGICRAMHEKRLPLTLVPRQVNALPYISLGDLDGGSARDVWGNTTSMIKHRRWLEHRGVLSIDTVRDGGDALLAFEQLAEWLDARWGAHSATRHPRAARFHRHVIPLLAAERRLRMVRLRSDKQCVAICYGLACGDERTGAGSTGWWAYYLAGYDRAWAGRIHLGRVVVAVTIDMAVREGATQFDFLKGAERYKYYWPVRDRITIDADVYSATAGAQLARARHAARELAAALVKSGRNLWSRAANATANNS